MSGGCPKANRCQPELIAQRAMDESFARINLLACVQQLGWMAGA